MTYRRKDEPRYVPEPKNPLCRSQWRHTNVRERIPNRWQRWNGWQRWSWHEQKWIDYDHPEYPRQWVFTSEKHPHWHEIPGVSSIEEAIKVAIALERLDALAQAVPKPEVPQPEVTSTN